MWNTCPRECWLALKQKKFLSQSTRVFSTLSTMFRSWEDSLLRNYPTPSLLMLQWCVSPRSSHCIRHLMNRAYGVREAHWKKKRTQLLPVNVRESKRYPDSSRCKHKETSVGNSGNLPNCAFMWSDSWVHFSCGHQHFDTWHTHLHVRTWRSWCLILF